MKAQEPLGDSLIREKLSNLFGDEPITVTDEQWAYREAAAVLADFSIETIKPSTAYSSRTESADETDITPLNEPAKDAFAVDCELLFRGREKPRWVLRKEIRRQAVRRLLARSRVRDALDANPERPQTPVQRFLESCLLGGSKDLSAGSTEEQHALLQVTEWLAGVEGLELPDPEAAKSRLARELLQEPFRKLVGNFFAGRQEELNKLGDYVGVLPAKSGVRAAFSRVVKAIFSLHDSPVLFIEGPGGMGKSTLVAQFILQHAAAAESASFPYGYLDFDRPGLLPEEPITLLVEVIRQLAVQYPSSSAAGLLLGLRQEWQGRIRRSVETREEATGFRLSDREWYLDGFASAISQIKRDDQPLLLVLDTFEEVQFRSKAYVEEVFRFLNDLQLRVPTLRVVLAGRVAPVVQGFKLQPLQLQLFDEKASIGFLRGHGMQDEILARTIAKQVGRTPLTLRLAVEILKHEKPDSEGIKDLGDGWLRRFQKQNIEVQLFTRILGHLHDKDLRQLAHPGLVVRRITPLVILEVLSTPCQLNVRNKEHANELFEKLRKEITIVSVGAEDELIHRSDIRALMLPLINAAEPEKIRRIHEYAVRFYEKRRDVPSRAEEIYHRLWLRTDRRVLQSRWIDGLGPYLSRSIEEIPDLRKPFLAARLGLEISDALWSSADLDDWAVYAERRARELLGIHDAHGALELLLQRDIQVPVLSRVRRAAFIEFCNQQASKYASIRKEMRPSDQRTGQMTQVAEEVRNMAKRVEIAPDVAGLLFNQDTDGSRIVALAMLQVVPLRSYFGNILACIMAAHSRFEQYWAMLAALRLATKLGPKDAARLISTIESDTDPPIREREDESRWIIADEILRELRNEPTRGKP